MSWKPTVINPATPPNVSPDVVRLLHWLAREAESGRVEAVAFTAVRTTPDGKRVTTEGKHAADCSDARDLVSGIEFVKHMLLGYILENTGAPDDAPTMEHGA